MVDVIWRSIMSFVCLTFSFWFHFSKQNNTNANLWYQLKKPISQVTFLHSYLADRVMYFVPTTIIGKVKSQHSYFWELIYRVAKIYFDRYRTLHSLPVALVMVRKCNYHIINKMEFSLFNINRSSVVNVWSSGTKDLKVYFKDLHPTFARPTDGEWIKYVLKTLLKPTSRVNLKLKTDVFFGKWLWTLYITKCLHKCFKCWMYKRNTYPMHRNWLFDYISMTLTDVIKSIIYMHVRTQNHCVNSSQEVSYIG